MRYLVWKVCFVFVLICILVPARYYAQDALHQIVRFDIPFGEYFTFNLETGGDLNGDGRPDLVFSCIEEQNYSNFPIYIYYSIPDSTAVPDEKLITPWPNVGGFGYSLAYAGDLNGDGFSDLAVSVIYYGWGLTGGVMIFYGGNPPFTTPDVFISGEGQGYTHDWDLYFGKKLITDCDVNGDGINDLLVYASGPQYEEWGNVYVYLGGEPFVTTPTLHIRGSVPYEWLGNRMETGDINGDGYDDIIVTNRMPIDPNEPWGDFHTCLKIYPGGETLTNVPIFETIVASTPEGGISAMISNGDLNGDGYDDIVLSGGSRDGVRMKVFYGQDDITGLESVDYRLGYNYYSIQSYVNLNNDPFSDLWVKLYKPMPYDPYEGSYAVYKQTSEVLNLMPDYVDNSPEPRPSYGYCHPLGDMNGDGFPEFFVHSPITINPPCPTYATILTESYVGNSDAHIQPATPKVICHPNPFQDEVKVRIAGTDKPVQITSLEVYNIKGQLVYRQNNLQGKQIRWNGLDTWGNRIGSGIYTIRARDKKGNTFSTRVVKIK